MKHNTFDLSRRTLLGGLGAGLALAGLSACSSNPGSGTSSATMNQPPAGSIPAEYAKRLRVVVWTPWGGTAGDTMLGFAKEFNESQSDIWIDSQPQGGYEDLAQKVAAGLQAKQVPDIAGFSEILWSKFWLNETIEPLDELIGAETLAGYNQQLLSEGNKGGTQWWLPFARSTPIFYYNRDLFAQVGLPDRAPKTWTEYLEFGEEIKGSTFNGNSTKLLAYPKAYADWVYMSSTWNRGGSISNGLEITIDSEIAYEAGEYQRSLIWDSKMAYLSTSPMTDFSTGAIASVCDSTGGLANAIANSPFEVGAGFIPGQKTQEVSTGGGGLSIMKGISQERKDAAAEYIKFLAQPANAAKWSANTGYLPATIAASKESELQSLLKSRPQFQVAVDQLAIAREADTVRIVVPTAQATTSDGLQRIYANNEPVDVVLADIAKELRKGAEKVSATYERLSK